MDLQIVQKNVISIAHSSGEILKKFFREKFTIKNKEIVGDLVTEADIACEKEILSFLLDKYPHIPILAEESGQVNKQADHDFLWVIDPIDGTNNFAHGLPFFAII
jgi:myo-inositol-1(or 4)-monophosphatase